MSFIWKHPKEHDLHEYLPPLDHTQGGFVLLFFFYIYVFTFSGFLSSMTTVPSQPVALWHAWHLN